MENQKKGSLGSFFHFLITSLFYPAVLGGLFYSLLDNCYTCSINLKSFFIIMACIGIIATFSIDYLYTYTSKTHYSTILFAFDIVILFFLFIGYQNLIKGITSDTNISLFFISFIVMHSIFLLWDFFFVPKDSVPPKIIFYDVLGLALAIIGLSAFKRSAEFGVIFLWIYTFLSVRFLGKDILEVVNKQYK